MNKKLSILIGVLIVIIVGVTAYYCLTEKNGAQVIEPNNNLVVNDQNNVKNEEKLTISAEDKEMYEKSKEAFPESILGFEKYVIDLDKKANEERFEVEVKVGKIDEYDCNIQMLLGEFEVNTVEGFGYDYFTFKSDGEVAQTLMGCPDETLTEKFVWQSVKLRYNSNLPVVVFVPEGFKVKYNIWSASESDTAIN